MSANPAPPMATNVAPDISINDMVRYLNAKHIGYCPSCHQRAFAPGNVYENQVQAVPTYTATGSSPAYNFGNPFPVAYMPTVHVICQNCGFIELFSAFWVKRWIEENPQ